MIFHEISLYDSPQSPNVIMTLRNQVAKTTGGRSITSC
jgi:hypothetical protein